MRDEEVSGGRILVLNGTSSSGKSTLANALLEVLPDVYEVVGLDQWLRSVPRELFVVVERDDHQSVDRSSRCATAFKSPYPLWDQSQ